MGICGTRAILLFRLRYGLGEADFVRERGRFGLGMQAMSSVGKQLMSQSLSKFEAFGGVVSGTEESGGKISLDRPNRQWDYPSTSTAGVTVSSTGNATVL
jgi:hypothetical protein